MTIDSQLRQAGFRIHSRPIHGPTVWIRCGVEYFQIKALDIAIGEMLERRGVMIKKKHETSLIPSRGQ